MSQGIIDNLVAELTRLPGIGRKSAQRLAFFILSMPANEAKSIADAIIRVKENARFCSNCYNITDSDSCAICTDSSRDKTSICVVEEPSNIIAVERTKIFKGLYHVLLGALSPLDGITPDKLRIDELIQRIKRDGIKEVILATNPNTKGEMTARYITELIKPLGIEISRIAYGLPIGSDIEFADEVTLSKALEGRRTL
ncbi:MAG: recombination protein RecR [Nitrospirae bacterium]|nr:recombination protein RecR [Nitrospirota bacterium]